MMKSEGIQDTWRKDAFLIQSLYLNKKKAYKCHKVKANKKIFSLNNKICKKKM